MTNQPIDFDSMTPSDFEQRLPDLFANANGQVSTDPRLTVFLSLNPDCAALVHDLETIAAHAKSLFAPATPSDDVWARIQSKLQDDPIASESGVPAGVKAGTQTQSGALSLNGEPNQLQTGGSLHDIE